MMKRRQWMVAAVMAVSTISTMSVQAAQEAPDELVKRISNEVLAAIKADPAIQAGDTNRIVALVDSKIMPNVNITRMT